MSASRPKPPGRSGPLDPPDPDAADDQRWLQTHLLRGGDLLLYGRLAEEFQERPAATVWKELRVVAERYLAAGPDRAAEFQRSVDATLEALIARDQRFGYPPPFCHKGCCACCHEVVYCTDEEARAIHAYCQTAGIPIDRARLARQLRHVATDPRGDHTGATTWNDQPAEDQACGFLDPVDGACVIWSVRPMVCRVPLAAATDAPCRPHNGREDPEARGISHPETSTILSAIFTLHRDSIKQTMGRLLLALDPGPS